MASTARFTRVLTIFFLSIQCLLTLLDSPLNKAGLLQVYIHTARGVLIEVRSLFSIFTPAVPDQNADRAAGEPARPDPAHIQALLGAHGAALTPTEHQRRQRQGEASAGDQEPRDGPLAREHAQDQCVHLLPLPPFPSPIISYLPAHFLFRADE